MYDAEMAEIFHCRFLRRLMWSIIQQYRACHQACFLSSWEIDHCHHLLIVIPAQMGYNIMKMFDFSQDAVRWGGWRISPGALKIIIRRCLSEVLSDI